MRASHAARQISRCENLKQTLNSNMQVTPSLDGGLFVTKDSEPLHLSYDEIRSLLDHLPADEWGSIAIRPRIPPSSRNGIRAVPPALKVALSNCWELVAESEENFDCHWQVVIRRFPR